MVDLYADNAYRFVVKHLKDADKAQDVIQDVFEKIWLKIEDISFEKSKSYLFTAAYRTMVDYIRREKKMSSIEDTSYIEPEQSNQYNDVQEQLNKALETIPDIQKSVILLRDYEGYNYAEIGEITSLTEAQVKVYIYRARKSLQKHLVSIDTII